MVMAAVSKMRGPAQLVREAEEILRERARAFWKALAVLVCDEALHKHGAEYRMRGYPGREDRYKRVVERLSVQEA